MTPSKSRLGYLQQVEEVAREENEKEKKKKKKEEMEIGSILIYYS